MTRRTGTPRVAAPFNLEAITMSNILKPQQTVHADFAGLACTVQAFLGGGGQGEVYSARMGDTELALKWYYPESATPPQQAALRALVGKGSPSDLFLWPLDLASAPGVAGFGYLMPLRAARFRSGVELAKRRIDLTFRHLTTAALHLADAFLQLHANGLAYRDISFGNLFVDPQIGDVLVCDLDNVGIDGLPHNSVGGTMRFMAPEIVRGEALPSTQTDQYSLGVLLHFLFYMAHPLEGQREAAIGCLDAAAQQRLYGTEPVYIADPKDKSNRPVTGRHDNFFAFWPIYPSFVKRLFTRAFTDGLRDPAARVTESEWRAGMAQLRDFIIYCTACGVENFYEPTPSKAGPQTPICWACKRPVVLPMQLHVGKLVVMLNHDTRLYPHHLDEQRRYDFTSPVAEVTRHPAKPDVWGLKNLSVSKWVSTNAASQANAVAPGQTVAIAPGTRISFGKVEGEVRLVG
jgi:DNA-binding helix-hairpin-helix protein with protein kinase domain